MDNILLKVEELKELILTSKEYKNYETSNKKLENNKEIKNIISEIKLKQKEIINKEAKNIDKEKEEFEVQNLFRKLNSYDEYNEYMNSAKELNNLISDIQKRFEDYFNQFVI